MKLHLRLSRLGGHRNDHSIEPSCGVLDVMNGSACERRLVIDCGLNVAWSEGQSQPDVPDLSLLKNGPPIDGIFITHAHFDHVGSLPALVPYMNRRAKVYMTKPTAAVVRRNWEFEMTLSRPADSRPYTKGQLAEAGRRIVEIDKEGVHEGVSGIPVFVQSAGHISGACSYTFRISGRNVHYTGDRCEHDQPGILGAKPLPPEWRPYAVAGSDCTYGDGLERNQWRQEMDRCLSTCWQALSDGRPVLLFTFALHRAAVLAHEFQLSGLPQAFPVFMDGSACAFTRMLESPRLFWSGNDRRVSANGIHMLSGWRDRVNCYDKHDSFLVIAPPGMGGPGGSGSWWRRRLLSNPDALVAFTGYVAPGTDGHNILEAALDRAVTGHKQSVTVRDVDQRGHEGESSLRLRCQIEQFRLGGHNGRADTVQWFRENDPAVAVLSHGSRAALERVESELADSDIRLVRADLEPTAEIDL